MSNVTIKQGADGSVSTEQTNQSVRAMEVQKPAKPEHVPEKFWDATKGVVNYEAWSKSTSELESKFTQQQQNKPGEKPADQQQAPKVDEKKPDGAPPENQVPQTQAFQSAAEKARAEWADKGQLTDETYKALADAGVDRTQVDLYLEGVRATDRAQWAEVFEVTGDKAGFDRLAKWAEQALTQPEQDAINQRLSDPKALKAAVSELHAKYVEANGTDGKKTTATSPAASNGVEPYTSKHDMMDAVKSPQYKASKEFRDQHALRIMESERRGINIWV